MSVAPVRERGLKYLVCASIPTYRQGRSRKGAWIEIVPFTKADNDVESLP